MNRLWHELYQVATPYLKMLQEFFIAGLQKNLALFSQNPRTLTEMVKSS
jgi:hypothetical protein